MPTVQEVLEKHLPVIIQKLRKIRKEDWYLLNIETKSTRAIWVDDILVWRGLKLRFTVKETGHRLEVNVYEGEKESGFGDIWNVRATELDIPLGSKNRSPEIKALRATRKKVWKHHADQAMRTESALADLIEKAFG